MRIPEFSLNNVALWVAMLIFFIQVWQGSPKKEHFENRVITLLFLIVLLLTRK